LFSIITAVHLVNLVEANFYPISRGVKPPDADEEPPVVSIFSPQDGEAYVLNSMSLTFNVSLGESTSGMPRWLVELYFEGDWQENKTYVNVDEYDYEKYHSERSLLPSEFSFNLTNIPEGKHTITVYANVKSHEWEDPEGGLPVFYWDFFINCSASINFTIDTVPPKVAVLSPENKTYDTTDIPLNFTVNEPVSEITYVLDGQANVTITGNMTLTELSEGSHTITVYANDTAGNIGTSETVYFSIDQTPKLLILGSNLPMEYGYAIVAATVIVAAIAGYLFLKILRRRPKQNATVNK